MAKILPISLSEKALEQITAETSFGGLCVKFEASGSGYFPGIASLHQYCELAW